MLISQIRDCGSCVTACSEFTHAATTVDIQQLHFLLCLAGSAPFCSHLPHRHCNNFYKTSTDLKMTDLKKQHFSPLFFGATVFVDTPPFYKYFLLFFKVPLPGIYWRSHKKKAFRTSSHVQNETPTEPCGCTRTPGIKLQRVAVFQGSLTVFLDR